MENTDKVLEFYNAGNEINRLNRVLGIIEFYRTKEIINKYIKDNNNIIYDIGGGVGEYSSYFASKNNEVYLLDISSEEIQSA